MLSRIIKYIHELFSAQSRSPEAENIIW